MIYLRYVIFSFAKKFEITDRVWNDILYDLDAQETIKTLNEIENEVLIFGANMTKYILLLQFHTSFSVEWEFT